MLIEDVHESGFGGQEEMKKCACVELDGRGKQLSSVRLFPIPFSWAVYQYSSIPKWLSGKRRKREC